MDAILLAAGLSKRMGDMDKQLVRLGGKPMFIFPLEKLLNHSAIERVIITCPQGRCEEFSVIAKDYQVDHCVFIEGGLTRQESVKLALTHIKTSRVLIHEAARPMLTSELISRVSNFENEVAVVANTKIPFTVYIGSTYMEAELDRNTLRNIQLPQVFQTHILRSAHQKAESDNQSATEDSMLVFRMGYNVKFVPGDVKNIKVTYPIDLLIAKAFLFQELQKW